jgi:hypothetical protein
MDEPEMLSIIADKKTNKAHQRCFDAGRRRVADLLMLFFANRLHDV